MRFQILYSPIFLLPFLGFTQAQNEGPNYSLHCYPVTEMVVFPGCESIDSKNIEEMQKCFQENLQRLLSRDLEDFSLRTDSVKIQEVQARVMFKISKEGKLTDIHSTETNCKEFAQEAVAALKKIAESVEYIRPAKLSNGENSDYTFALPISMKFEKSENGKEFDCMEEMKTSKID